MRDKKFTEQELEAIRGRLVEAFGTDNMSQIARSLGVGVTTFHNYIVGRSVIPMRILNDAAKISGVSVDYLLTGNKANDEYKIQIIKELDGTDIEENSQTRELLINVIKALPRKSKSSP